MAPTNRSFSFQANELFQAAKWVEKALSKDAPLYSIRIAESMLTIEAYGGFFSSVSQVPVDQRFPDETKFSVNAKQFIDTLKNMGSNSVTATFMERKLVLVAPKMRYTLHVTVPRTTPTLPELPSRFGTVEAKEFLPLLKHAASMASDDLSTPSLTTVHFDVSPEDGFFKMSSTDRYRMVIRKVSYVAPPDASKEPFSFGVNARHLKELVASLDDSETIYLYAQKEGNTLFGVGNNIQRATVGTSEATPVNFDAFAKTIPSHTIVVRRKEIMEAITKTKNMMRGTVRLATFFLEGDEFSLVSHADTNEIKDIMETTMDIEIESHDFTEDIEFTTNLDYIGGIIQAGSSEYLRLGYISPLKPITVNEMKDETTINPDYFSLFMGANKPKS